jgi:hypothetical protein
MVAVSFLNKGRIRLRENQKKRPEFENSGLLFAESYQL